MQAVIPEVLWKPDPRQVAASEIAEFTRYVRESGVPVPDGDYAALHAWSVRDLAGFWSAAAKFTGVRFHQAPVAVLSAEHLPGARWFPGGTLNYAEHALSPGPGRADEDVAVVFAREDGLERQLSWPARPVSGRDASSRGCRGLRVPCGGRCRR
jgi:acetoacetyl-CoA synthetase